MPVIENEVVNPGFGFTEFLMKKLDSFNFIQAEGLAQGNWHRGYCIRRRIPREGKWGKFLDLIFLKRFEHIAFVFNLKYAQEYGLEVNDPEMLETFADYAEEYEGIYKGRQVTITPIFYSDK